MILVSTPRLRVRKGDRTKGRSLAIRPGPQDATNERFRAQRDGDDVRRQIQARAKAKDVFGLFRSREIVQPFPDRLDVACRAIREDFQNGARSAEKAADQGFDGALQIQCRQAPSVGIGFATLGNETVRDVVPKPRAGLRLRMRWRQPITGRIEELAGQQ